MGQHMLGWGVPRNTGRVYAYLLLRADPAGLDQIAHDLEVGKSSVSVGARQLVAFGLARAVGERGSRRVLYDSLGSIEAIFAARNAQALDLMARLRQGAGVAESEEGRQRLAEMADLLQEFVGEAPALFEQLRDRRRR